MTGNTGCWGWKPTRSQQGREEKARWRESQLGRGRPTPLMPASSSPSVSQLGCLPHCHVLDYPAMALLGLPPSPSCQAPVRHQGGSGDNVQGKAFVPVIPLFALRPAFHDSPAPLSVTGGLVTAGGSRLDFADARDCMFVPPPPKFTVETYPPSKVTVFRGEPFES